MVGGKPAVGQGIFWVVDAGDATKTPFRHLEIVLRLPLGSAEEVVIKNTALAPPNDSKRVQDKADRKDEMESAMVVFTTWPGVDKIVMIFHNNASLHDNSHNISSWLGLR